MRALEGRDGIDLALDQTLGARGRIQRGWHNMKVAAVTTVMTAGAATAVDVRAGLVAGAVGAAVTLLAGVDEITMPYLDGMEFPRPGESSQEIPLAQGVPTQIS